VAAPTPQGVPELCPECDAVICLEPGGPVGDAACPYCRKPLWFVCLPPRICYYGAGEASADKRRRIVGLLARWMKTDAAGAFQGVRLRGLDAGGLVGEIERDFGRRISLRDIATIRSMPDLVDFLVRDCPE
jgi:hypothetical protein